MWVGFIVDLFYCLDCRYEPVLILGESSLWFWISDVFSRSHRLNRFLLKITPFNDMFMTEIIPSQYYPVSTIKCGYLSGVPETTGLESENDKVFTT